MNKTDLTLQFFQRSHLLRMTEDVYQTVVFALFDWLLSADGVARDRTGNLFPEKKVTATIISKQDTVIAGLEEVAFFVKEKTDLGFEEKVADGDFIKKGTVISLITGNSREVLSLERTILNMLQRMSGIATETQKLVRIINSPETRIAATRKTPWGLLDKKAVAVGGGLTHRLSLADGVLIKDNHLEIIKSEFGITNESDAVKKALELVLSHMKKTLIEIEINTAEGAVAAIRTYHRLPSTNALAVMFDNWEPEKVGEFIKKMTAQQDTSNILFEASGNISEENIPDWGTTGVQVISLGALTHSPKAADLSLEIHG
jgi:nicotinate-nucleotide pyrophosphorylase (carboxylating)